MADFGLIGLGTMGSNLALNIEDHGVSLAVWNLETERTTTFVGEHPERAVTGTVTFDELVAAVERPRRIMMMIPAGKPVDQTLDSLVPLLDSGDIVIDGGNSHYPETARRGEALAAKGIHLLGVGVSGGSDGARHGPSLMPGGPREAYTRVEPVLTAIAARVAAGPCVGYLGPGGAGHFVKMVHNGIEYADMQSIAEAYDVLKRGLGLGADELAGVFAAWNEGPLASFLIEITAQIFGIADPAGGGALVEAIVDEASQKGTGRWTATAALELGVAAPSITAAVDARVLSSRRAERLVAADRFRGPEPIDDLDREATIEAVGGALYATRIAAFAQGMDLIGAGSAAYGWNVPRAEVARVWMGGCIIRARLLDLIRPAFDAEPELTSLLLDGPIGDEIEHAAAGARRALGIAESLGIPTPCWGASVAYYDAFRTARLPQNLTQAQRDYFGAHRYRRLDDPEGEPLHTNWGGAV